MKDPDAVAPLIAAVDKLVAGMAQISEALNRASAPALPAAGATAAPIAP